MSDVSTMGPMASAYTWQPPGDTPVVSGVVGRLMDLTAAGWVTKFASEAVFGQSSETDQGLKMEAASQVLGGKLAASRDWGIEPAGTFQHGREVGSMLVRDQGPELAEAAALHLASLSQRDPALIAPKRLNVARVLTSAEKQALDEYVSQGKPSEQRARAAERITCFIGSNASALMLNDLGLVQLPDIVKTLRLDTLDVSGNKLAELPLPAEVTFLHVSRNALTAMPVLPEGTRMVFAAGNRIREFRGPLPDTLSHVNAPNNMLDALPPFPASMVQFDIEGNTGRLTQADVDARICPPLPARHTHIPA